MPQLVCILAILSSSICLQNPLDFRIEYPSINVELKDSEFQEPLIVRLVKNTDDYIFYRDTVNDANICDEHLCYLGKFANAKKDKMFQIMTYSSGLGIDCKVTSRILVYSNEDEYLGNYYTHGILPTQILGTGLLMGGKIVGDFSNGIPDSLKIADNFWVEFEKKK